MHSRCRGCLVHSCIYSTWYFPLNWNSLTTKFTLFWSRCTLLCIEYQAGLSSSIEITDKLHRRGARQVACAGFAIVSNQNTEYCKWPIATMEVPQLLSWCPLYLYCICVWWESPVLWAMDIAHIADRLMRLLHSGTKLFQRLLSTLRFYFMHCRPTLTRSGLQDNNPKILTNYLICTVVYGNTGASSTQFALYGMP